MSPRLVLLAMAFVATPAMAFDTTELGQGGTLLLKDIMPLIGKAPVLKQEVAEMLHVIKKQPDDVICSGHRFPAQWANLGGMRVSPYACDFGSRWLQIKATVRVTGYSRQLYDAITPAAMLNAARVAETDPTWTWTAQAPGTSR